MISSRRIYQANNFLETPLILLIKITDICAVNIEYCSELADPSFFGGPSGPPSVPAHIPVLLILIIFVLDYFKAREHDLALRVVVTRDVVLELAHVLSDHDPLLGRALPALPLPDFYLAAGENQGGDKFAYEKFPGVHFRLEVVKTHEVPGVFEGTVQNFT